MERFRLRISSGDSTPFYHIMDYSDMENLYPNYRYWLSYDVWDYSVLGIYDVSILVGFIIFKKEIINNSVSTLCDSDEKEFIYIKSIYINKNYRKMGILRMMLRGLVNNIDNGIIFTKVLGSSEYLDILSKCFNDRLDYTNKKGIKKSLLMLR